MGRKLEGVEPVGVEGAGQYCSCSSLLACPLGRTTAACPGLLAVCCHHPRPADQVITVQLYVLVISVVDLELFTPDTATNFYSSRSGFGSGSYPCFKSIFGNYKKV